MRALVRIFTIIFASAVGFALIANPKVLDVVIKDTSGLVTATRGSK